jgi:hypothetical protein
MTTSFRYDSSENYHLTYSDGPRARRQLIAIIFLFSIVICVFFPALIWFFSFAEYPASRGVIAKLIYVLPVYLRLPLVVLTVLATSSAMIAFLVRLADRRADFLFGPDGIAHVGLFVSKSLLWNDIGALNLVHHRRRYLFIFTRSVGHTAEFIPKHGRGATVRPRSKFAALLSIVQTSTISVDLGFFEMTPEQFERTMLFLRPGLEINRKSRMSRG